MASILKKIGKQINIPYHTFNCDDKSDMEAIDVSRSPMGSRCYVINDGDSYILNSKKEWKLVPRSSGGGSGGDIIYDGGEEVDSGSSGSGDDVIYDGGEET